MNGLDPRITPVRPDLAAAHLRGTVAAQRFVLGTLRRVAAFSTPVRREPRTDAPLDTEALSGEEITIYDTNEEGWAWGQLARDGYVGFMPADDLVAAGMAMTHAVAVPRTFVYPGPSIKMPPLGALPLNAQIAVERVEGEFAIGAGGFVFAAHLLGLERHGGDPAHFAEQFVGVPYLWGGKTSLGLDCSALVQLSLQACGLPCPRDSDMQAAAPGTTLSTDTSPRRGDLVHWNGHVGMMLDGGRLVHASGHHMMVVIEPLAAAAARILGQGGGPVTCRKRLDQGSAV